MPNSGLIDEQTSGVYVISITPFAEDGSIDFKSVDCGFCDSILDKGPSRCNAAPPIDRPFHIWPGTNQARR